MAQVNVVQTPAQRKAGIAVLEAAHPFQVEEFAEVSGQREIFRLLAVTPYGTWHSDAVIDHSVYMRSNPLRDVILAVEAAKENLGEYLYQVLGTYPFARLWMMQHLQINVSGNRAVPGWAWVRFKSDGAHVGKVALKDSFGLVDKDSAVATQQVAKPKRKVATVKPEVKKPPRKPKCPIHTQQMKFDTVRGVWTCETDGCKQIALPKRDRIEGQLLLGKGKVGVRLVYPDKNEPPRLILISDDNVALDITDIVHQPVQELIDLQGVDELIEDAIERGVPEVTTKTKFKFEVRAAATVMGVEHAP